MASNNEFTSLSGIPEYKKDMIKVYINSATVALYWLWCSGGKKIPIDEAIDYACSLIIDGVKSIRKWEVLW